MKWLTCVYLCGASLGGVFFLWCHGGKPRSLLAFVLHLGELAKGWLGSARAGYTLFRAQGQCCRTLFACLAQAARADPPPHLAERNRYGFGVERRLVWLKHARGRTTPCVWVWVCALWGPPPPSVQAWTFVWCVLGISFALARRACSFFLAGFELVACGWTPFLLGLLAQNMLC